MLLGGTMDCFVLVFLSVSYSLCGISSGLPPSSKVFDINLDFNLFFKKKCSYYDNLKNKLDVF